jgi:hypothetical protein
MKNLSHKNSVYIPPSATATNSSSGFMSSTDKEKLNGIATNAVKVGDSATNGNIEITSSNGTSETISQITVYSHPNTDGNLHVPETGTSNNGRFLKAGSTSGSISWSTIGKSDVGLGSVENTAISTWTGSTNISTIGTISSGTWNGTTINTSYGGTGLNSIGSSAQILGVEKVDSGSPSKLEYKTISGTTNQISVQNTSQNITFSLPQDVATTSDVSFKTVTINSTDTTYPSSNNHVVTKAYTNSIEALIWMGGM